MDSRSRFQGRAAGLVRTLVVASTTLAILLICFWIYQAAQTNPSTPSKQPRQRLPSVTQGSSADRTVSPGDDTPSVSIGRGKVGPGSRMNLTIYPRGGTRARFEISVADWTPITGTPNEFRLTDPELRMRTPAGNAVRVTARQGILEAERKGGGRLDPRRGRLAGDVVIEIDRRTDADRAALPPKERDSLSPVDLVRIELEEIEFDLEYAKVRVPGQLHLSAHDVELTASDVLIRFNGAENRVEYLRINRGGRLELHEKREKLGLSLPGAGARGNKRWTLAQWMLATIQSRIDARAQQPAPEPPSKAVAQAPQAAQDSLPVFDPDEKDQEPGSPVMYFARFEGDVDARQVRGEHTLSRLQADVVEILRGFTDEDLGRMQPASASPEDQNAQAGPAPPTERIVLNWSTRLVVEALDADDDRLVEHLRSRITAAGAPVRLSFTEGAATCRRLVFEPDGVGVRLFGTELDPVIARSADHGTMVGVAVSSERTGDALHVEVTGPGALLRDEAAAETADASPLDRPRGSTVEFAERLEVDAHFVTKTTIDFVGGVSRREYRVLDRATFTGRVMMVEDGTRIDADTLTLAFGSGGAARGNRQVVQRVAGHGHVAMVRAEDRLSCREIDMVLTTDRDGKAVPLTATASGDVVATQGSRTIRARDRLIVDFKTVHRPAPPFDAARAYAEAIEAGLDVTTMDWAQRRREHEAKGRTEVGAKRLRAFGDVGVLDPVQALDLTADRLDCTIGDGGNIETALLTGADEGSAFVMLNTFTVAGREISLNVPDQWASVPGAGRLTFRSRRDLDGRKADQPIPISIEWSQHMNYMGRENRAVFSGRVHATSENETTFNCEKLLLEFEDIAPDAGDTAARDWWIFTELVERFTRNASGGGPRPGEGFSKEPVYVLATGNAVAETSEFDSGGKKRKSRSRISGPRLSVNLRPEVSKMLIEGPGDLLLEDFRDPPRTARTATSSPVARRASTPGWRAGGLFGFDENAGPSATLVEWEEFMWYDFSIDQTRFQGNVTLKHLSGAKLAGALGRHRRGSAKLPPGRATFLDCDALTVDFLQRDRRLRSRGSRRMGRLSSERLRRFQASGSVVLQDRGVSLTADRVNYERERNLLEVLGSRRRPAHISIQEPNELPQESSAERFIYDIASGRLHVYRPTIRGR